jgi:hypothetical protein
LLSVTLDINEQRYSMKNMKRFAATVLLAVAAQASHAGVIWVGNGHEYDVIRAEGITWTDAQTAVAALGSGWHLATVTSAAEDAFLSSQLSTALPSRSHFWLGATDAKVEGTFEWVTGEAFAYTNWSGGEPNNAGNEDFLAYDLRGTAWGWNDAPDALGAIYGFARGYVIERSAAVPEPSGMALVGLALLGAGITARRRRQ